MNDPAPSPIRLDMKKDVGLTIVWSDGSESFYSVAYLRRMSPSADMKQLREQMASNPLTVLPRAASDSSPPLTVTGVESVGRYAVRIAFSDGHDTGIYSWDYFRQIRPQAKA